MRGKVLIIVHQPTSTPGRVGVKLKERGFELDIRRPCLGEPLPECLDEHHGVVIFGGPMSANDCQELDFIRREIDWLELPLRTNVPFLGVCLGAQLLARHLGARSNRTPKARSRSAITRFARRRLACSWCHDGQDHVYHWHREGFELPRGAELLAEGEAFANQAFRYGKTMFGIQFHPEVTQAMLHRWTVRASHRLELPGAQPRSAHLEGRLMYDHAVADWLDQFLCRWLAGEDAGATK
jgi:GMP synthase (glutamine-hydrolysing)